MVTLFISAKPTNVSRVRSVHMQRTPFWHWRQIRPTIRTLHASYPPVTDFPPTPFVPLYCTLFLFPSFMAALSFEKNPFKVLFISLAFTTWQWIYHLIHLFLSKHYFFLLLQTHFTGWWWLRFLHHSKYSCWGSEFHMDNIHTYFYLHFICHFLDKSFKFQAYCHVHKKCVKHLYTKKMMLQFYTSKKI